MKCALFLFIGLMLVATPGLTQKPANRWKCTFTTVATSAGVKRERFELEFIVDTTTGKAVVVGNNGMDTVGLHVGDLGISFMEPVKAGAVQTTTIDRSGRAVHSRHTILGAGELFPSQYYGNCR